MAGNSGFTQIANELLEALIGAKIPREARQVLDVIIRKTYGFNKRSDWVSLSQFSKMTELAKPNVQRALKRLIAMRIVLKGESFYRPSYSINETYKQWQKDSRLNTCIQGRVRNVLKAEYAKDSRLRHTKDTLTKDILTKHTKGVPYEEIIADLNQVVGSQYRHKSQTTRDKIAARFNEGFTLTDFFHVHRAKAADWLGTERSKFLRPETLYGSKFEGYRNQQIQVKASDLGLSEKGLETAKALARTGERVRRGEI